jgi:hypothetical protein
MPVIGTYVIYYYLILSDSNAEKIFILHVGHLFLEKFP